MKLLQLLMVVVFFLSTTACGTGAKKEEATSDEAAAESSANGDGLTEEPMGEGEEATGAEDISDAGAKVEKTLYDRVGGRPALEKFADKFIDSLKTVPTLQKNPTIMNALKADQTRHKQMLVEYFCEKSGGPCKYTGKDLKTVHAPLKMSNEEFLSIRKPFIKTLRDLGVPKKERMELALIAAREKKNIVSQ